MRPTSVGDSSLFPYVKPLLKSIVFCLLSPPGIETSPKMSVSSLKRIFPDTFVLAVFPIFWFICFNCLADFLYRRIPGRVLKMRRHCEGIVI